MLDTRCSLFLILVPVSYTHLCAYTMLDQKRLKVYRSKVVDCSGTPGQLLDSKRFIVACADHAVEFCEVQYEGSKRMSGPDFLRGKKLEIGKQL